MKESSRQLEGGVVLSYINLVANLVVYLVYTPLLLRCLGQKEYGIFSICSSLIGYLGILNFGFTSSYVRFYSKYKVRKEEENIHRLDGMFISLFIIIGSIVLILGLLMTKHSDLVLGSKVSGKEQNLAKNLLIIMAINMSLSMPLSAFSRFISSREKFVFLRILELFSNICNPIICTCLLFLGFRSIAISVVVVIITIINLILSVFYCRYACRIKFIFDKIDRKMLAELVSFSFFIFLQMIMDQVNWHVDKFLLVRICGSSAVAIYTLGSQFNTYYVRVSLSVCTVMIPTVHRYTNENNDDALTELFVKVGRIQAHILMFVLMAFIIYGKAFIKLWVGDQYDMSYLVALVLLISIFIPLTQNIGFEVMRAKNQHKLLNVIYIIVCILNILISIPLCNMYGAVGSAVGTAIATIISLVIINNIFFVKKGNIRVEKYYIEMAKMFFYWIPCALMGYCLKNSIPVCNWNDFLISAILFSVIYLGFMYIFGLNQEERSFINQIIKKKK